MKGQPVSDTAPQTPLPQLDEYDDPEVVAQYPSVEAYLERKAHFVDMSPETATEDA